MVIFQTLPTNDSSFVYLSCAISLMSMELCLEVAKNISINLPFNDKIVKYFTDKWHGEWFHPSL